MRGGRRPFRGGVRQCLIPQGGARITHVPGRRCLCSPVLEAAWQRFPQGEEDVEVNVGNAVSLGRRAVLLVSGGQA